MKNQIHLGYGPDGKKLGAGYSGRGVRVRTLSPTEVQHIRDVVGQTLTENSRVVEFEDRLTREGVQQSIVEYTDEVSPSKLPEAKWLKATPQAMNEQMDTLFTAKDIAVLSAVYRQHHVVTQKEIDSILGGLIGVVD